MVERKGYVPNKPLKKLIGKARFCIKCGRKLRSKQSIARGMGPICARVCCTGR
jgi:hypothetical protein